MKIATIPPKLLASLLKKWEDANIITESFKKSEILGPNTWKDVVDFVEALKKKRINLKRDSGKSIK
jgi:hypothetical protein